MVKPASAHLNISMSYNCSHTLFSLPVQMSAPFQLSVSLSEAEYEKYGHVLQKVLANLLSDSPFGELNRSKQMENFPEKVPDLTKSAF